MKKKYPYFVVQLRTGRSQCPLHLKNTVIERQFKSGRIGGTKVDETICYTAEETYQIVSRGHREQAEVLVYLVLTPGSPRHTVHNCHAGRGSLWTFLNQHVRFEEVDSFLEKVSATLVR